MVAHAADRPPGEQSFADALRAAGWQVEVLIDGSLQLSPANEAPTPPSARARSAEPANPPPVTEDAFDWSPLRAHGWRVETDAAGATLLYPPVADSDMPAVAAVESPLPSAEPDQAVSSLPAIESPPALTDAPAAQAEIASALDSLLAERGWRVERSDGSVFLYPLGRPVAPEPEPALAAVEPCSGSNPEAVRSGRVALPIDGWGSVRTVAQSWLDSLQDPGLRLGKVRQIFRVYLVSIVDDRPPHALRHQIAIDVADGRVMVLN